MTDPTISTQARALEVGDVFLEERTRWSWSGQATTTFHRRAIVAIEEEPGFGLNGHDYGPEGRRIDHVAVVTAPAKIGARSRSYWYAGDAELNVEVAV